MNKVIEQIIKRYGNEPNPVAYFQNLNIIPAVFVRAVIMLTLKWSKQLSLKLSPNYSKNYSEF